MTYTVPDSLQSKEHSRVVSHIDLSNDGTLMAVSLAAGDTELPATEIYATKSGEQVAAFHENVFAGRGVAFSPDAHHLCTLAEFDDGRKLLQRISLKNEEIEQINEYGAGEFVDTLHRDRDGHFLAVAGYGIEVWRLDQQEMIRFKTPDSQSKHTKAAFSADGRHLYLYGLYPEEVVVLDVPNDEEAGRYSAPTAFGEGVAVSPEEKYLAIVGASRGCYLYDLDSGERLYERFYNEGYHGGLQGFLFDESLMLGNASALRLPELELKRMPIRQTGRSIAFATAWQAPVFAYSNRKGGVFWARLEDEEV